MELFHLLTGNKYENGSKGDRLNYSQQNVTGGNKIVSIFVMQN